MEHSDGSFWNFCQQNNLGPGISCFILTTRGRHYASRETHMRKPGVIYGTKENRLRFTLLSMLLESPTLLSRDAFTACQSIASNYGYNALNWLNGRGARLQLRKLLKGCAVACREPSPESCVQVCIGGETGLNRGRCQELIALGCTAGMCVYSNLTLS